MAENSNKKSPLVLILLLISLLLNGWLFYSLNQKSTQVDDLTSRVDNLETVNDSLFSSSATLSAEIDETVAELDEFKGLSTTLDSLLDDAKKDISAKQTKINKLYREVGTRKNAQKELEKEIAELKTLKETYLNRVDSLIQANDLLQVEVAEFKESVQKLESKVEKGSVLTIDNIRAVAYKERKNGTYKATVIASKTGRIEICFDLLENKIAETGQKEVHIKVVGPDGVIISSGTETFDVKEDSTQSRFTTTQFVDYENQTKNYCLDYKQGSFGKGNYQVEVYSNGNFGGVGAFILK